MTPLSARTAIGLFAVIVVAWGLNWPITKLILQAGMTPLWFFAIRSAIATAVLLIITPAAGSLRWPQRGDWPIVFGIALLHMSLFCALMGVGLQYVPVGRSVVLGYSTPLWVVPGAIIFLKERMTPLRACGVALGLAGIAILFNPAVFDWHDRHTLIGNGFVLLASVAWAVNMLQVRAHRWVSTPFQLVVWETVIATIALTTAAAALEGAPHITWNVRLSSFVTYTGVVNVALAYWALAVVNRSLSAVTMSIGMLATPVLGIFLSIVLVGEPFDPVLLVALLLIVSGIGLEIYGQRRAQLRTRPGNESVMKPF